MATVAKHTIKIKNYSDVFEEYEANATITPGHLIEVMTTGKVRVHAAASGNVLPMFAIEDELQGNGIDDNYTAADQVQCWVPGRGDIVNAILADGQNVSEGAWLESAGNGTLQAYSADSTGIYYPAQLVGQAIEAVNLSGSSGTHPASGLRIKVRIY